ncbi:SDR family NAD(P)-dependent oxidoreductase [Pseudaestuariivita atlantica]|uniref:Short-chain dehydrogenase n=1 Tax=Pseudaestuariivita atlantica TaxID=1317121 RepID=A0A0L1JNB4_9RHOB|nr:SDR family oxidoreductase [Pseudaestuariivita atlantica]KNG93244.1 short-chain dehydrogenase [Pseudaestuariivita atlantica]
MRFEGKTALVTGASSGMGAATARMLAARGARVFTAQRRNAGFEDIEADLMDPDAPRKVINFVQALGTDLHILVNCAGMMREGTVEETSLDDWHAQLHLNLTVPFLFTRHAMPLLKRSKGAIVNVGSIEGLGNNPRHPAYGASKAGLHGLTRAVAVDHGPDGVRCNAVAPGWIDTPLNEDFIASQPDAENFRTKILDVHPLRRTGAPDEVAELICWLASDDARFVTGQVYTIDGGRTAQLPLP